MAVAEFVTGILLGRLVGADGRPTQLMVICPPEVAPDGLAPSQPPGGVLPAPEGLVVPSWDLEPYDVELSKDLQARGNSVVHYMDKLLDARLAFRVLLRIVSTLNQAVTVQVVGHVSNSPRDAAGLVNIGSPQTLVANGDVASFGINLETDWQPYFGLTVTTGATGPTTGTVQVSAHGQHWVRRG